MTRKKLIGVVAIICVTLAVVATSLTVAFTYTEVFVNVVVGSRYEAEMAGVDVSASYYSWNEDIDVFQGHDMLSESSATTISIGASADSALSAQEEMVYSKEGGKVILEYAFVNNTDKYVNIDLIATPEIDNMLLGYAYEDYKIHNNNLGAISANAGIFRSQTIAAGEAKYIYIILSLDNKDVSGSIVGDFEWSAREPHEYVVSFNLDNIANISDYEDIIVLEGLGIDNVVTPLCSSNGYAFTGWFKDASYTQILSNVDKVYSDITLFPQFKAGNVTVSPDGVVSELPNEEIVVVPDSVVLGDKEVKITKITGRLGKNVREIYIGDNVESIPASFANGCENLEKVWIGDSLKNISSSAFIRCTNLNSVRFGKGLTNIAGSAFYECINLQSIDLQDGLKTIGSGAFYGCDNLRGKICFPETLEKIDSYAFYMCKNITGLKFGEQLKEIGYNAFYYCYNIKGEITLLDNVTNIGSNAFAYCTNITKVATGNGLKKLNTGVFYGCSAMKEIVFSDSLTSIGDHALYNCVSLKELNLPNSLTTIEKYALQYCSAIRELVIPENVKKIEKFAFSGMGISEITIPESVESIGEKVFDLCIRLNEVNFDYIGWKYNDSQLDITNPNTNANNLVKGVWKDIYKD